MPYKKNYKKNYRKKNTNYLSKTTNTNSMYRRQVPRTLQIATRRNKSQVLRFVTNQTYQLNPGGLVGGMENCFLTIRANSIYNIMRQNGSLNSNGTWIPQDNGEYGPLLNPNATGWSEWTHRYQNFTVLGSKISATFEPTGVGEAGSKQVPSTFYLILSGADGIIGTGTEMALINKFPYTKRASVIPGQQYNSTSQMSNQGVRLSMNYSTKRFEGVRDVKDNNQLTGEFNGHQPSETSFFYVGLRNTIPSSATADRMPQGLVRIKVEYIVSLSEPTETNQVQMPAMPTPGFFGGN